MDAESDKDLETAISIFPNYSFRTFPWIPSDHFRHGNDHQARFVSVEALQPSDTFPRRHNSATPEDKIRMAESCGYSSRDSLIDATVPKSIRISSMNFSKFDAGLTESQMISHMQRLTSKNKLFKSFIGMGYYGTLVPDVILRNIMENPGWYTQYTPYQAEIAQGRLESLLNYQTMISDLTALPMSNVSLLDEGTAAGKKLNNQCNLDIKSEKIKARRDLNAVLSFFVSNGFTKD